MTNREGDGAALYATSHPPEITEEMVKVGLAAATKEWTPTSNWENMVRAVYTAMAHAAPPWPEGISEDALVEAEVEIKHDPWQPIESAPKDGTEILIYWRRPDPKNPQVLLAGEIVTGLYGHPFGIGGPQCWLGTSARSFDGHGTVHRLTNEWAPSAGPTHWMPLPAGPQPKLRILDNGT